MTGVESKGRCVVEVVDPRGNRVGTVPVPENAEDQIRFLGELKKVISPELQITVPHIIGDEISSSKSE